MIDAGDNAKPFSEACEQNKHPILEVLREVLANSNRVLEIGSGTGQHAVFFGAQLPHLTWQTSELPENHSGIRAWLAEARLANVLPPLALNVADPVWPVAEVDAVFSANTAHIMAWPEVETMFAGSTHVLAAGGRLCLYGPFNYHGDYTSKSNAQFDAWLKGRDPRSGIRDFEALDALAQHHGMTLLGDYAMPVNNRTLVWEKSYG